MLISVKLLNIKYIILIYALGSVHEMFVSESKVFLIDLDAELFMFLIQCIRSGS